MDTVIETNRELLISARKTLSQSQKTLESKWFYDVRGSELFEEITELDEYYPTRSEIGILRKSAESLANIVPSGAAMVELGSGASVKTRILLDAFEELHTYAPLDISGEFLQDVAAKLQGDYPHLNITPLVADFMSEIALPEELNNRDLIVFFPGSSIGNLTQHEAIALLHRVRSIGRVKALILGADLIKAPDVLVAAYDDAAGVTAEFNRNLLYRLNKEAGGTFDTDAFIHQARWNPMQSRIEMHLVSQKEQTASLGAHEFTFREGESIHTENSHKYSRDMLSILAEAAGWTMTEFVTDADDRFSVSVLVPN